MAIATKQFEVVGSTPFLLDGPLTSNVSPSNGSGNIMPAATLGSIAAGDAGSEFVYCKLVLDGSTVLVPGTAYVIDKQYTATLLTTSNSPRGSNVAWGLVNAPTAPVSGTYYIWLQRAGNLGVRANGTPAQTGLCETSATGGVCGFPSSATTGAKLVVGTYIYATTFTFTASTINTGATSARATLTNIVMTAGSDFSDIVVGATITGTGIPASTYIGSVSSVGGVLTVGLTTSDLKTAVAATATGTAVTMTVAGTLVANAAWPYVDKTN